MSIRLPIFALICLLLTEGVARADDRQLEDLTAKEIVFGVVRSVRRGIAIGPTFGLHSAYSPSASDLDAGLSFGLKFAFFKSTIPTPSRIKEIALEKAKEKLAKVIAERFGGQTPDAETLKQLMREIVAQVKAELFEGLRTTRTLERPRLAIVPIEANYLFSPSDWLVRLGFGVGFGPVSIGPSFSVRFGDDTVARLGGELSIYLLPTKSPRSPVLDVFLRGDFELHARQENDDQVTLGVRLLLDII